MRYSSFTSNGSKPIYCYKLRTGDLIRSNGEFTFDTTGNSIENHTGFVNDTLADCIKFNSNDILIRYEY